MERGRDKFSKYRKYINLLRLVYSFLPAKLQSILLEKHRNTRGYWGQAVRYVLLKNLARSVGYNVSIKEGVFLYNVEKLSIGNNVSIWPMVYIDAYGGITIGNDVSIAHATSILSFEHTFVDHDIPIKDQEVAALPVTINDNIWIGARAVILGGTTIQSGSVVGAGSVVTKDIGENTICVGVPARLMKRR